ncbi:b45c74e7-c052-4cff-ba0a-03b71e85ec48 [Thermothielavioides terrestris]|uniref:B45c74e7-c052-4cff-ba0a-03b71e85ec48 n=1 Tax=Thermothielavioides terrestris TaxID=2587410 RepID=A0A3S4AXL4_9PEZI|nr:b45c74e7-c052-4cff-ba0a-03b71e85ec48 [Thermothielavioides terrestris]
MATATALFVIDIQNDLATDPQTRIPHAERIREAGAKILSTARAIINAQRASAEEPPAIIVFVQHEEEPENGPLVRGSEPWKLVFEPDEAAPSERLVAKWTAGDLNIVAFGIQSEYCVEASCNGALAAGFEVVLLSGAHSTYDNGGTAAEEIEKEVEERLRAKGAKVVTWEEAVAVWESDGRLSFDFV